MAPERTSPRAVTAFPGRDDSLAPGEGEGPSREEVRRKIDSLYDRAESDTGTFNATRAAAIPRQRGVAGRDRSQEDMQPAVGALARQWFDAARAKLGPTVPVSQPDRRTPARPDRAPQAARPARPTERPAQPLALEAPKEPTGAVRELTGGSAQAPTTGFLPELPAPPAAPAAAAESPWDESAWQTGAQPVLGGDGAAWPVYQPAPAPAPEPTALLPTAPDPLAGSYQAELPASAAETYGAGPETGATATYVMAPPADPMASYLTGPSADPVASYLASPSADPMASYLTDPPTGPVASYLTDPPADPVASYLADPPADLTAATYGAGLPDLAASAWAAPAPPAPVETAAAPAYAYAAPTVAAAPTAPVTYAAPEALATPVAPGSWPSVEPGRSTQAERVIAFARAQIGRPCVWGAVGPGSYDAPGLTQAAWKAAGVTLPRTAQAQWAGGMQISLADVRVGDLVFFHDDLGHVGIWSGDGMLIHAPGPGSTIREESVFFAGQAAIKGAVRPA
ncbi:NlpC/P60 family protein [Streptomyces sp. NPDC001536]|uniref:C40 family peptidase n=1 Tax=Streptomyces sp. NPDC001536 TaxID=3364583 RepID=UPI00368C5569